MFAAAQGATAEAVPTILLLARLKVWRDTSALLTTLRTVGARAIEPISGLPAHTLAGHFTEPRAYESLETVC